ncbi:MAG: polysaccharide deacetylase family protein [Mobilitalea sp.]
MYHEIRENKDHFPNHLSPIEVKQAYDDKLPPPLFVTLENFILQMEYLHENNYHTLTLTEIMNYYYQGAELPEKSVLLTFDDCYQSLALYAYPCLKKYKMNAVAFVVSGWLNDEHKHFQPEKSICLSVADLKKMTDVFEFANHSDLFHTRINQTTSRMMIASDEELSLDLDHCNGSPIVSAKNVFAYPFGLYTDHNVSFLREKGFRLAFTTQKGRNDQNSNPLLLYRNVVPYFMDLSSFQELVG